MPVNPNAPPPTAAGAAAGAHTDPDVPTGATQPAPTAPSTAQPVSQAFINELAEAGLYIDPDNPTTLTSFDPDKMDALQQAISDAKTPKARKEATKKYAAYFHKAVGRPNAKQLSLMQKAANKYGLTNDDYDTGLVYMTASGVGVDLRTGETGDGRTLSDAELEQLRIRAGYDPEYAYQAYVEANTYARGDGSAYTSYAARPENRAIYDRSLAASRLYAQGLSAGDVAQGLLDQGLISQEYYDQTAARTEGFLPVQERTGATPPATTTGEGQSFLGGFDFGNVPTVQLEGAATSLQKMLSARQAKQQATQGATGDFFQVDELLFPQDEG